MSLKTADKLKLQEKFNPSEKAVVTGKQQATHAEWTTEEKSKVCLVRCTMLESRNLTESKLARVPRLAFYFLNKLLIDF